jgi:hypothetical protein
MLLTYSDRVYLVAVQLVQYIYYMYMYTDM